MSPNEKPLIEQHASTRIGLHYLSTLWRYRLIILSFTAVSLLIAVFFLHLVRPVYTVTMSVVAETIMNPNNGSLKPSPSLNLLSSISGLGAGGGQQDLFDVYLEGLRTTETAQRLSADQSLMKHLFADEWSDDAGWHEQAGISYFMKQAIKRFLGYTDPPWSPPNTQRVKDFLTRNVTVTKSQLVPTVDVSIETADPKFGVELLEKLHLDADEMLRQRTLLRTTKYIQYLDDRLSRATVVEYRTALAETIVEQDSLAMAAGSGLPFAGELFSPPMASSVPTYPNPTFTLISSALLGLFVGSIFALAHERWLEGGPKISERGNGIFGAVHQFVQRAVYRNSKANRGPVISEASANNVTAHRNLASR